MNCCFISLFILIMIDDVIGYKQPRHGYYGYDSRPSVHDQPPHLPPLYIHSWVTPTELPPLRAGYLRFSPEYKDVPQYGVRDPYTSHGLPGRQWYDTYRHHITNKQRHNPSWRYPRGDDPRHYHQYRVDPTQHERNMADYIGPPNQHTSSKYNTQHTSYTPNIKDTMTQSGSHFRPTDRQPRVIVISVDGNRTHVPVPETRVHTGTRDIVGVQAHTGTRDIVGILTHNSDHTPPGRTLTLIEDSDKPQHPSVTESNVNVIPLPLPLGLGVSGPIPRNGGLPLPLTLSVSESIPHNKGIPIPLGLGVSGPNKGLPVAIDLYNRMLTGDTMGTETLWFPVEPRLHGDSRRTDTERDEQGHMSATSSDNVLHKTGSRSVGNPFLELMSDMGAFGPGPYYTCHPPSRVVCRANQDWRHVVGIEAWCTQNCVVENYSSYCDDDRCSCTCV